MSKHTITATIPHGDRDLGAEIEVEIAFSFTKGSADYWNRHIGCWEQGYPAELSLISAKADLLDMGAFQDLHLKHLEDVADNWLQGDGYDEALAVVAADDEREREYAAELRAERANAARVEG